MSTKGRFNIYVKLPKVIQHHYSTNPNVSGEELYRIFKEYLTKGRRPLGTVPAFRKATAQRDKRQWIIYRRPNHTGYRIIR